MNTPIPIALKSHRGIKNNIGVRDYNIPLIKASLRTYELPLNTIVISHQGSCLTYRYCQDAKHLNWGGWSRYAQLQAYGNNYSNLEYSGMTDSFESHTKFMRTIDIVHPIMLEIFSVDS